jgi:outer membrane immunogenic protein
MSHLPNLTAAFDEGAYRVPMIGRPYTKAPVVAAVVYDWTGFYIGGNAG